jgi:hypothetical protein
MRPVVCFLLSRLGIACCLSPVVLSQVVRCMFMLFVARCLLSVRMLSVACSCWLSHVVCYICSHVVYLLLHVVRRTLRNIFSHVVLRALSVACCMMHDDLRTHRLVFVDCDVRSRVARLNRADARLPRARLHSHNPHRADAHARHAHVHRQPRRSLTPHEYGDA